MYTAKGIAGWSDSAFYEAALDALTANVAVLDAKGEILAVNDAWVEFANLNDFKVENYGVGSNYLTFCDDLGADDARKVAEGLRALLNGGPGPFRFDYVMPSDVGPIWAKLTAVRLGFLHRPFLIVAHEDVSIQRRAEAGLREATARLLHAEDNERRRIARDLHDSTAQYLTGAKLMLHRLNSHDPVNAALVRDEVDGLLSSALDEIRSFAYLLHPPALEHLGLASAIRQFASGFSRRTNVAVMIEIPEDFPRIPHATEIALYRVVQEALANVHRHSGSPRAVVSIRMAGEMVLLTVRDFGAGLPIGHETMAGVGLEGMRLRLEFLKGQLSLLNVDPGLLIEAWVPVVAGPERSL